MYILDFCPLWRLIFLTQSFNVTHAVQTSPKSSVHAFDFRDVTERNARNMQKRAIGELRGLGTRLHAVRVVKNVACLSHS
jgi:hypothetical protein